MFWKFVFSRIWSSAQDCAIPVLLLNLFVFFISTFILFCFVPQLYNFRRGISGGPALKKFYMIHRGGRVGTNKLPRTIADPVEGRSGPATPESQGQDLKCTFCRAERLVCLFVCRKTCFPKDLFICLFLISKCLLRSITSARGVRNICLVWGFQVQWRGPCTRFFLKRHVLKPWMIESSLSNFVFERGLVEWHWNGSERARASSVACVGRPLGLTKIIHHWCKAFKYDCYIWQKESIKNNQMNKYIILFCKPHRSTRWCYSWRWA